MGSKTRLIAAVGAVVVAFAACDDSSSTGGDLSLIQLDAGYSLADGATSTPIDAAPVDASAEPADAADAADASLCGNGVVDPGETCDGDCPTSCADGLTCTLDTLIGAPSSCNVACEHAADPAATVGDGCCAPGKDRSTDPDCGFLIDPVFKNNYEVRDLGTAANVPTRYGGLIISRTNPNVLLIGGGANASTGAIYALPLQRDASRHIIGIAGPGTLASEGPNNDGGMTYAPNGVLVYTRYSLNQLGFIKPGSTIVDKVAPLTPLRVASSVGGLQLVPAGHPGAGSWKVVSWSGGQWYDLTLAADATGTFDVTAATYRVTLSGGPEGIAYVPLGSPLFTDPSVLISEYSAGKVSTYVVDALGNPVLASRREILSDLAGAEGAAIDPLSGDFLFSTFGGQNKILVVRGFAR